MNYTINTTGQLQSLATHEAARGQRKRPTLWRPTSAARATTVDSLQRRAA